MGSPELNIKIVWSLARWLEAHVGREQLEAAAKAAQLSVEEIDRSTYWVSLEQIESFLAAARMHIPDDNTFLKACGYRFNESYDVIRYMVQALTEQQFFEAAVKTAKFMTRISHFEILRSARNEFEVRYFSTRPESRLLCLSRQASWLYGPTIWAMPPAHLTEKACIARGDDYCEYHLRWFDRRRLLPILGGAALGAAVAAATAAGDLVSPAITLPVLLPILGALLGYLYELRRAQRANLRISSEVNQVLRDFAHAESEARSEIIALHQRQRDWIRLMEQQVAERTATLETVVHGLQGLQQSRVTTLRGFSHDLRNPLFVVRGNTQFLRDRIQDVEGSEALHDMETATAQIDEMLTRLMEVATQDPGFVRLAPEPQPVAPLAEMYRRRLKALVHGRDIKVSVFCTREAPDEIVIDPLVFDRVVDNFLTNAAKYTHQGSILLEISGTPLSLLEGDSSQSPGFLTLKLSDTGEGISPADVQRIFRPRPNDAPPSRPDSYGIGLSSVVRLLAQIGGRIDVMSKPAVGTTFWAHFPVKPIATKRASAEETLDNMITNVVTIRKVEN
ncbi:MAG: HAMP domain-containing histidine kinase [Polyangiaceae bacterium]|nr:HAMP domain-containing histidine kinase [Polyangiaceae bacterium]